MRQTISVADQRFDISTTYSLERPALQRLLVSKVLTTLTSIYCGLVEFCTTSRQSTANPEQAVQKVHRTSKAYTTNWQHLDILNKSTTKRNSVV